MCPIKRARVRVFVCLFEGSLDAGTNSRSHGIYTTVNKHTHTQNTSLSLKDLPMYFRFPKVSNVFHKNVRLKLSYYTLQQFFRVTYSIFTSTQDFEVLQAEFVRQYRCLKSRLLVHMRGLASRTVVETHIGNSILKCVLNNHLASKWS